MVSLLRHPIAISVYTGLAVSLVVVAMHNLFDRLERYQQQRETKAYVSQLNDFVLDTRRTGESVWVSQSHPEVQMTDDLWEATEDEAMLRRFEIALDSLELHVNSRAVLISTEDRFALLEPIIDRRNAIGPFLEFEKEGGIFVAGLVVGIVVEFFAELRDTVDWLRN